ncbi:energy transducer TonB [Mucilaginibacter endophyticus]|uniref:energy transducer TonB n=1 Tax=Mucilaginibacter endophyticus TaxID=2675003 RepID=UPI00137B5241|nr:energy transducer TonB [Mucilaginibacter endophyticus]
MPDTAANTVFSSAEKIAEFPGGITEFTKFIDKNVRYPEKDKIAKIEGRAIATFIVERDGSLTDIKILKSPTPGMEAEALRLLKLSPKWQPAMQNGRAVRFQFPVAISFKLPK